MPDAPLSRPEPSSRAAPATAAATKSTSVFEAGVVQRMVCAALCYAVTIAPITVGGPTPIFARIVSVLALVAGAAGPMLVPYRLRLGRHVGISAFVGLATLSWILAPLSIDVARVDVIRATLGAFAWAAFALSWGEPWKLLPDSDADGAAGALRARATLPPLAVPIAALGVIGALTLVVLAWQVADPSRALASHAAAGLFGVLLVTTASTVAVSRGKSRREERKGLSSHALRALILLAFTGVAGAVVLMIKSAG